MKTKCKILIVLMIFSIVGAMIFLVSEKQTESKCFKIVPEEFKDYSTSTSLNESIKNLEESSYFNGYELKNYMIGVCE